MLSQEINEVEFDLEDVFDYVNETLLMEEDKIRLVDLKE